jgi:hypothetical protein
MTPETAPRTDRSQLALGVSCDGEREAVGAKFWLAVLNDLRPAASKTS